MVVYDEIVRIKDAIVDAVPTERIYLFGPMLMVRRTTKVIMIFM